MMHKVPVIFGPLVGLLLALAGQTVIPQTCLLAAGAAAVSAGSEAKLKAAFENLYNLRFTEGLKLFYQVIAAEPESASASAFLASGLLYEILARQGTLQSQLFATDNEFLHRPRVPVEPEFRARFQETVDTAQRLARQRLEKNPEDADGLFALGLTHAALANFAAGVERKHFQGLRQGEKAYKHHKKLRKIYPEIWDTGVVLGVREYVVGSLPGLQRFFLSLLGARGSRHRGLEYMRTTAKYGNFFRTYARVLLGVASIREGNWEEARTVLESLRVDYPHNYLISSELAKFYRRRGYHTEAAQVARELLAELTHHPPDLRILGPEDALLDLARTQAASGKPEEALVYLQELERMNSVDNNVLAWAFLERGRILDQRGERESALLEYEKVIQLAADPEAIRLAHLYKDTPH